MLVLRVRRVVFGRPFAGIDEVAVVAAEEKDLSVCCLYSRHDSAVHTYKIRIRPSQPPAPWRPAYESAEVAFEVVLLKQAKALPLLLKSDPWQLT